MIKKNRINKRTLLTGNSYGEVYAFVTPDSNDTLHFVRDDRYKECMECSRTFSVLGKWFFFFFGFLDGSFS